jgi:trigger factor
LPDEFLKKWLVKTSEKPVTLEEINSEYNNFSNGMKWQLIRAAIIKENELKIEEEEIINEAKGFIKSQYAQYGQLDVPEEELKKIAGNIIGNEEERKKIIENLFETKSVEVLRNTMKTKEKEVVYEEFMKIVNQESKKSKSGESGFAKFLKSGFRKKQK